ncbi:alpha/beta fold hydrolase [Mucilaginibacter sp.]|uniref:alpha/beta fold hydrolase n=1 Tax=Mucilaginibacter sp. TaxID=1882438 RepID=UPI003D0EE002
MGRLTIFVFICFLWSTVICKAQKSAVIKVTDRQQFAQLGDFKLEGGGILKDCRVGYRTYGHLNESRTNGVLFPTWFGGTAKNVEQYMSPWKVVDTTRFFLIIVDALGDGVSSSPSNSVRQHGPAFPAFSIGDMVQSQYQLLIQKLNIKHLHAVMGISMGGFQTFQWGVSFPDFADCLIPLVGSPQLNGYDLYNLNIVRKIIEADTAFNHGHYKVNPIIAPAAMYLDFSLTTPAYKAKTIPRENFYALLKNVEKAPRATDWNDTYYQLIAVLGQDIAKNYNGSLSEAAKHIKAKMLIITSLQDHLVNPAPAIAFSKLLPAKLIMLNSELGHQAPNFDDPEQKIAIKEILAAEK